MLGASAGASHAYTFGTGIQPGQEQTVFDWTTQKCEDADIPDLGARAFRDQNGLTQLIATHFVNHRGRGFDLNGPLHECPALIQSGNNSNPAVYNDKQWIGAPFTLDGRTVYSLMHLEHRGQFWPGQCDPSYQGADRLKCMYYSIAFARSTDGGNTYVRKPAPADLVATPPYVFAPSSGAAGYHQPSNILYRPDGYYYVLVGAPGYRDQQQGTCLLRTRTISDPTSWRAWDGSGFSVRFIDPYVETSEPPQAHVCRPVQPDVMNTQMTGSLSYNTYFGKYMATGSMAEWDLGADVSGFHYSLSDDLIHWSPPRLLMQADVPWTYNCEAAGPVQYPSLLYPGSPYRNYSVTTAKDYLYFTRFQYTFNNPTSCYQTLDRDLVRIPVRFTSGGSTAPAPNCFAVKPSPSLVTNANNRWVPVHLSDPTRPLMIEIKNVFQDEPTDGIASARYGTVPDQVRLRAASDPDGDGRVYRIWFVATGGTGTCWGITTVGVTRGGKAVDTTNLVYNALLPP